MITVGLPKLLISIISFTHPPIPGDFIGDRIRRNLVLEDPKAAEANALEAQPGLKLGIQNPPKDGLRTPGGIWPHRVANGLPCTSLTSPDAICRAEGWVRSTDPIRPLVILNFLLRDSLVDEQPRAIGSHWLGWAFKPQDPWHLRCQFPPAHTLI